MVVPNSVTSWTMALISMSSISLAVLDELIEAREHPEFAVLDLIRHTGIEEVGIENAIGPVGFDTTDEMQLLGARCDSVLDDTLGVRARQEGVGARGLALAIELEGAAASDDQVPLPEHRQHGIRRPGDLRAKPKGVGEGEVLATKLRECIDRASEPIDRLDTRPPRPRAAAAAASRYTVIGLASCASSNKMMS